MSGIGVIGGSGLYGISSLRNTRDVAVNTPFGEPSAPYRVGELSGARVAFLPRHGLSHGIPPHRINYRANLWGFKELEIERILSINASGGINTELSPGRIVLLEQVIDFTQGARQGTFYDDEEVVHVDFTDPYCPELRRLVSDAGAGTNMDLYESGTYICVNGPRLESRAEIGFFGRMGADVIGMTGMPEASLARELEMCFSGISIVTNYAAGISERKLTTTEVVEVMKESNERIVKLLEATVSRVPALRSCACGDALEGSRME
jgi:5'-methylthioadenosine phosphorylase